MGVEEPLTIKIRMIRDDMTEVSVRSGHMGHWSRENAESIHATILNVI